MRFIAVAIGTVVGGLVLSTILVLLLLAITQALGVGEAAGAVLLVLAYVGGFALAGWLSYRQFGAARTASKGADDAAASTQSGEPPPSSRRVTPWAPVIVIAAFIAIAIAWIAHANGEARRDAQAFCASAVVGQPLSPVAARAESTGNRMGRVVTAERVTVALVGFAYLRHFCTVTAENGVIRSASYHALD